MSRRVPWRRLSEQTLEADGLVWQLQRELGPGHVLDGVTVRAIGRRQDNDDVLYALDDGSQRVALVTLTWAHCPADSAALPPTQLFVDVRAWAAEGVAFDEETLSPGSVR